MDKELPSYYSVIPATVRYDHNLKANEKLMYGEITALSSKNGYCWAENRYFAELYDVHKITISKWLKNLEDNGYIRTELKYVYGTKQVSKRYIYINDAPISQNANRCKSNGYDPVSQNAKEELSTTSNNNTSKEYTREFENFWNLYDLKKGKHEAFIKWRNLSRDEQEQAIAGIETFKTHFSSDQYTPRPRKYLNNRYWEDEGYSEQADNENSNINKFF